MKRYVAQRMEEDIETCIEIVKRKAARIRKARNKGQGGKKAKHAMYLQARVTGCNGAA